MEEAFPGELLIMARNTILRMNDDTDSALSFLREHSAPLSADPNKLLSENMVICASLQMTEALMRTGAIPRDWMQSVNTRVAPKAAPKRY